MFLFLCLGEMGEGGVAEEATAEAGNLETTGGCKADRGLEKPKEILEKQLSRDRDSQQKLCFTIIWAVLSLYIILYTVYCILYTWSACPVQSGRV